MKYGDALRILELDGDYTEKQLKKNYRNLMKKYHPDLHTKESEQEKLILEKRAKDINEAYEILAKSVKHRSNNTKTNSSYETTLERTKKDVINKLNTQLERLKNFFASDAFIHKGEEIRFIKEAIINIRSCTTDLEIFNVMNNLKFNIEQNNLDLFNSFVDNWQIDSIMQKALDEIYYKYSDKVKYTKSIIDTMELIERLKQECYSKVNEYENKIRRQINQKLDRYVAKYSNSEFYFLISNEIEKAKQILEDKICDIYFDAAYEESKEYFNDIIAKLYHQFEKELLNLLKKATMRNKKITKLYDYFLNERQFQDFLNSKVTYLYTNILSEDFDNLYEKIADEVNSLYRQLKIEKMDLNKIKNNLLQNYVVSVSRLDTLKDSEEINSITRLYQQALQFLTSVGDKDVSLDMIPQLLNVDFSDLDYAKKTIIDIIFYSTSDDCDIYIKRKKSSINGNIIKARSVDRQVEYDYNIEKLNCNFSSSLSLREFKENYISLQQFLQQATYIGKYAKANQYLLGNVKGVALYATADNVLFLDLDQNKFKFVIDRDNISYFDDANVSAELKDKVEVYKLLMEQYSLVFDADEITQPKTKKFSN